MADEPKIPENETDDELLLDEPLEPEAELEDEPDPDADEADEEEEDVLTFGDEAEPQPDDSNLVKHLREQIRIRDRKIAESATAPRQAPIEVGEKPTIANCEYDEELFETRLDEWKERKRQAEAQQGQSQQAAEAEQQAWQAELGRYNDGKAKLGFADVDDVEETVKASLDTIQQAVIVKAADDPAKVIYALGKHPERLATIAKITDPLKLAAAIARLEGTLKMVKRRKAPEPEKIERGSGKVAPTSKDKRLAKLEAEAERTGDRTELVRYKKSLKEAAAKK